MSARPKLSHTPGRIDNLTGIRGFAVLGVIVYHVNLRAAVGSDLGPLARHGFLGVDLFFVLSGFVLSLVYVPRLPVAFQFAWWKEYLLRRLAKIYPMHLLTFLLMVAVVLIGRQMHYVFTATAENTPWSAFCQVTLLNAEGLTRELSWNTPSWSVGAEWFAYVVLFAPIVFLLRTVRLPWLIGMSAALWCALILLSHCMLDSTLDFTSAGVLRIIPEFFSGYVLYRLHARVAPQRRGELWAAAGLVVIALVAYAGNWLNLLLLPALMLLLSGLYRGGAALDAVFGNRLAVLVGECSYSIYLTHLFVNIVCFRAVAILGLSYAGVSLLAITAAIAAVACAVGFFCFRFIEEPIRQALLNRFSAKARNPGVLEASAPSEVQTASTIS